MTPDLAERIATQHARNVLQLAKCDKQIHKNERLLRRRWLPGRARLVASQGLLVDARALLMRNDLEMQAAARS
jgi:hypothetical protein